MSGKHQQGGRFKNFKLYSYWKSSSTWRVRIALHAKQIPFETIPIKMTDNETRTPEHKQKNPMGQIPVLEFVDTEASSDQSSGNGGRVVFLTQSVAIIEFLDEVFPDPPLLPSNDPLAKARAKGMVEMVNSGIQPRQNVPMLRDLEQRSQGAIKKEELAHDAITTGLAALELVVASCNKTTRPTRYCLGDYNPSMVDLFSLSHNCTMHVGSMLTWIPFAPILFAWTRISRSTLGLLKLIRMLN